MSMQDSRIAGIRGRAVPLRGDDIDTDRIIPARFLKCVVFDGLGEHAFEDDRAGLREQGREHNFDKEAFAGAEILLVNKNFGCGSSREHAPQAIQRWGIRAIAGESFAEIFFGNCQALGLPCVVLGEKDVQTVMACVEKDPRAEITVDLEARELRCKCQKCDNRFPLQIPEGVRKAFLEGKWDSTAELLAGAGAVEQATAELPYFRHWR